jgi:hypothetical protein
MNKAEIIEEYHAIIIGVNHVDTSHYSSNYQLKAADKSIEDIEKYLREKNGLTQDYIHKFQSTDAKWSNVKSCIEELKIRSKQKNIFVLTYFVGHGFNLPKEFLDKYYPSQFLYFFERMVLDKEFNAAFIGFSKSTKICWVIDSCYSEGLSEYDVMSLDLENSNSQKDLRALNRSNLYFDILNDYKNRKFKFDFEILTFAACDEMGVTYPDSESDPTSFTKQIVRYLNSPIDGNYYYFYQLFSTDELNKSTPKIYPTNQKQDFFKINKPFKIDNSANINSKYIMGLQELEIYNQQGSHNLVTATLTFSTPEFKLNKIRVLAFNDCPSIIKTWINNTDNDMNSDPDLVMIIIVEEGADTIIQITQSNSELYYKADDGKSGAVIVISDPLTPVIHGGRPVLGDVDNTQGG